jgi:hypothetical protein
LDRIRAPLMEYFCVEKHTAKKSTGGTIPFLKKGKPEE